MLAFIHIEKTAGSTLTGILRGSFGTQHCDVRGWREGWTAEVDHFTADDLHRTQRLYRRLQSIAGHGVRPYADLERVASPIRYYTFLREPLARCASHYQYQVQRMGRTVPFLQWIRNERYRNFQVRKLAGVEDADAAIRILKERVGFVGLVERYNESLVMWQRFCKPLAIDIRYRSRNVAEDATIHWNVIMDRVSCAALEEANQEDIRLYRHAVEEIYPRQQMDYGADLPSHVERFQRDKGGPGAREPVRALLMRHLIHRPIAWTWRRWAA